MDGTFRPLLNALHDRAGGGTCLALAWMLSTASSCSLQSSPVGGRADSKEKARGWQPATAQPQASDRGRADLDAGLDASPQDNSVSQSRPRNTRDAGRTATEPRDASTDVPPPPAADAGSSAAAGAEAPIPMMQSDAQQDAAIAIDAATPLDASSSPDGGVEREGELHDCQPGQYTGEFSGELAAAGIPVSVVAGPVMATLTLAADGRYLDLSDATVFGRDALGSTVWATLTGKINCATLELEAGQLERGRYYMAARRASLSFDGVALGTYATSPHGLQGTWSVSARAAEIITGEGEFTLVRSE